MCWLWKEPLWSRRFEQYTLLVFIGSWRRAEYTVWNVETTTACFRANTYYMVVPASLLVIVTSYYIERFQWKHNAWILVHSWHKASIVQMYMTCTHSLFNEMHCYGMLAFALWCHTKPIYRQLNCNSKINVRITGNQCTVLLYVHVHVYNSKQLISFGPVFSGWTSIFRIRLGSFWAVNLPTQNPNEPTNYAKIQIEFSMFRGSEIHVPTSLWIYRRAIFCQQVGWGMPPSPIWLCHCPAMM